MGQGPEGSRWWGWGGMKCLLRKCPKCPVGLGVLCRPHRLGQLVGQTSGPAPSSHVHAPDNVCPPLSVTQLSAPLR